MRKETNTMKKFMFVMVAVLVAVMFVSSGYALEVKSKVNNFNTGSDADHEQCVVQVYNNTDAALASGDVLVWDLTNDDGRSVTKCNGLGQEVAGVANEAIAADSWGDMLVYGYHSAVKVYGATGYGITAGYPLYAYGTDNGSAQATNTYDGYAGGGYLIGTARLAKPFGKALDAVTAGSATTVEAFVNTL